jgi:nucleoside-diphosphate-sugar epimerase
MKKVYINGAYGGLGTDICDYLEEKGGYKIFKSSPKTDITNQKMVMDEIINAKPDIVIHLAAMVGTKDCEEVPEQAIETNSVGTLNVIEAVNKINAKMIYFSTTAIYKPGTEPILEDSPIAPHTIYGKTKYWGELHVIKNIPWQRRLIVRPCFGFGGRTDVSMLGALIKSHHTGKWVNLLLDMNKKKDYTHVRNISHALYLMLEAESYGDYNVSYGQAIEYGDLIDILHSKGIYPNFKNFPDKDYMENHVVDNSKLKKDLTYEPLISLEEGIDMVIKSYEQKK